MFLVEQNAFHALKLAHRGYVMVNGKITLSGTGRRSLKREGRAAYLEGGATERRRTVEHQNTLIWEVTFWEFLLVTVILAGCGLPDSRRAMCGHGRAQLVIYMVLLAATRFIHFALFQEPSCFAPLLHRRPGSC